ncbi:MAG: YlxR family protein [Candidatus Onthovivens sp.]|nr:YlxR family protein [Candidatus Onthovivens sp.]
MKKVPMRTCLVNKQTFPKKELFRVVRTPDNQIVLDITGKLNGRGAYIHKDPESIEKARKTRALDRALECSTTDELYDRMYKFLDV